MDSWGTALYLGPRYLLRYGYLWFRVKFAAKVLLGRVYYLEINVGEQTRKFLAVPYGD